MSTCCGDSLERHLLTVKPAAENTLSDGTDVPGVPCGPLRTAEPSPWTLSLCGRPPRLSSGVCSGGWMLDTDTFSSVDITVVAHFKVSNTGAISAIICQYSSRISGALASCSFVTVLSDRTAVKAHLCSGSLPNVSHTEFHRVLHDWMSRCFVSFVLV